METKFFAQVLDVECGEYREGLVEVLISQGPDEDEENTYKVESEIFPKIAFQGMNLRKNEFLEITYSVDSDSSSISFKRVTEDVSHLFVKHDPFKNFDWE